MAIVVMLAFSSYELLNDTCANTITLDTVYVESLNVRLACVEKCHENRKLTIQRSIVEKEILIPIYL